MWPKDGSVSCDGLAPDNERQLIPEQQTVPKITPMSAIGLKRAKNVVAFNRDLMSEIHPNRISRMLGMKTKLLFATGLCVYVVRPLLPDQRHKTDGRYVGGGDCSISSLHQILKRERARPPS